MTILVSSINDAPNWNVTRESSIAILEVLFEDCKKFIEQATVLKWKKDGY